MSRLVGIVLAVVCATLAIGTPAQAQEAGGGGGGSSTASTGAKTALVCKLLRFGQPMPSTGGFNFGLLLDGEPTGRTSPSVAILENVDEDGILSGAEIVQFHDYGNGHFLGATGPLEEAETLVLILSKSSSGKYFDAGVRFQQRNDLLFHGACGNLITEVSTEDFHRAMALEMEKK